MQAKRTFLYIYLTTAIVVTIILLINLIRVPYPLNGNLMHSFEGPFNIFDLKEHIAKYDSLKIEIKTQKFRYAEYYKQATDTSTKQEIIQQVKQYLLHTIHHEVIPFWYDTQWDFNGTTENPRQGTIACGYFVTTVLRHAGLGIDKYDLSRFASWRLIDSLCHDESIRTIKYNNTDSLFAYMDQQEDGIYILGLAKHVGFIVKSQGESFFIHSRRPRYVGVIKEKAKESPTVLKSSIHVIGNLLANDAFIEHWLLRS